MNLGRVFSRQVGVLIHVVDEHAHDLFARAMGVNLSSGLFCCFDLNPFFAGLDRVIGVDALDDQVWMSMPD